LLRYENCPIDYYRFPMNLFHRPAKTEDKKP